MDIWHIRTKEFLDLLAISLPKFLRDEGKVFEKFRRDHQDYRYTDIFEVCKVYERIWGEPPRVERLQEWLESHTDYSESEIVTIKLRLESRGLVSKM